jgi:hypothetical protein
MSRDDMWEQAAACILAAHATPDPDKRAVLLCLQDIWISLAKMAVTGVDERLAPHVAAIARMQAHVIGPTVH